MHLCKPARPDASTVSTACGVGNSSGYLANSSKTSAAPISPLSTLRIGRQDARAQQRYIPMAAICPPRALMFITRLIDELLQCQEFSQHLTQGRGSYIITWLIETS